MIETSFGSTSLLVNISNNIAAGSTASELPYSGWRTKPTARLRDIGYTGHRHNNVGAGAEDIGLIYMNARFYVPGIGRFASADTLVPDPANPQSYNRYSYVLNNALRYTDPTGHSCYNPTMGSPCVLSDGTGNSSFGSPAPPKKDQNEPPSNLLTHLPLDRSAITGQSGFGPNWYATYHCNQACYSQSHNIHTGLDFFTPAGSTAYATVSGEIVVIYQGDANPNVVIKITVGGITYYVVHGHVVIDEAIGVRIAAGEKVGVTAGEVIGTLQDQGANSHVHLGIRRKTEGQDRAYNPLLFMDPALTVGMNFVSESYPYYGHESPTSIRSFLYGTGSYYNRANRRQMEIVR